MLRFVQFRMKQFTPLSQQVWPLFQHFKFRWTLFPISNFVAHWLNQWTNFLADGVAPQRRLGHVKYPKGHIYHNLPKRGEFVIPMGNEAKGDNGGEQQEQYQESSSGIFDEDDDTVMDEDDDWSSLISSSSRLLLTGRLGIAFRDLSTNVQALQERFSHILHVSFKYLYCLRPGTKPQFDGMGREVLDKPTVSQFLSCFSFMDCEYLSTWWIWHSWGYFFGCFYHICS